MILMFLLAKQRGASPISHLIDQIGKREIRGGKAARTKLGSERTSSGSASQPFRTSWKGRAAAVVGRRHASEPETSKPIKLRDGRTIASLIEARALIVPAPLRYQIDEHWKYAAELLLGAAVDEAFRQLRISMKAEALMQGWPAQAP